MSIVVFYEMTRTLMLSSFSIENALKGERLHCWRLLDASNASVRKGLITMAESLSNTERVDNCY